MHHVQGRVHRGCTQGRTQKEQGLYTQARRAENCTCSGVHVVPQALGAHLENIALCSTSEGRGGHEWPSQCLSTLRLIPLCRSCVIIGYTKSEAQR